MTIIIQYLNKLLPWLFILAVILAHLFDFLKFISLNIVLLECFSCLMEVILIGYSNVKFFISGVPCVNLNYNGFIF